MTQFSFRSMLIASILTLFSATGFSATLPLSQFAQCVAKQQCQQSEENNVLACCKTCLSGVNFGKQQILHDTLHEHLDLACSQFTNQSRTQMQSLGTTAKPLIKLFLLGSYVHTSGKGGCNRDQIMWSAPINLYQTNTTISGSTNIHHGIIRVYPLARCEDGQIGDVISSHQLNVSVQGKKVSGGEQLHFTFDIAPDNDSNQSEKSKRLIALTSELAALSFNKQNEPLKQWLLDMHSSVMNPVKYFTTNDEANAQGWKGKTDVFIEEVKSN